MSHRHRRSVTLPSSRKIQAGPPKAPRAERMACWVPLWARLGLVSASWHSNESPSSRHHLSSTKFIAPPQVAGRGNAVLDPSFRRLMCRRLTIFDRSDEKIVPKICYRRTIAALRATRIRTRHQHRSEGSEPLNVSLRWRTGNGVPSSLARSPSLSRIFCDAHTVCAARFARFLLSFSLFSLLFFV